MGESATVLQQSGKSLNKPAYDKTSKEMNDCKIFSVNLTVQWGFGMPLT